MFKLRIVGDLGFEVWQDIPGYEGRYQASTYGRIKSLERKGTFLKVLKPIIHKNGYAFVDLYKNNRKKRFSIHRLISMTFLPKWENEYTQVNHKDENKLNNRVENLEWCTCEYNINYGTGKQKRSNSKSKTVLQLDISKHLIRKWKSATEVEKQIGYSRRNICFCCNGKRKTAHGFLWQYAE